MVDFLIAGIQRSGSTYIRRCLDSHPMIQCYGEVFLSRYRDPCSYSSYISASFERRVGHVLYRAAVVNRYLDYLTDKSVKPIVGFKLMRSQVSLVPYRFPMLLGKIRNGDIKAIQIIRRNVLKTYLSRLSSQASGRYHTRSDVEVAKLAVNTKRLLSRLDEIHAENDWWSRLLSGYDHILVEYEEFVASKENESRRILEYLGVDHYEELTSANRKINPDDLSRLVDNYPELEATLRGTRYEYCLEPAR